MQPIEVLDGRRAIYIGKLNLRLQSERELNNQIQPGSFAVDERIPGTCILAANNRDFVYTPRGYYDNRSVVQEEINKNISDFEIELACMPPCVLFDNKLGDGSKVTFEDYCGIEEGDDEYVSKEWPEKIYSRNILLCEINEDIRDYCTNVIDFKNKVWKM